MASYCGVPLLVPTPAQTAWVSAHFDPLEIHGDARRPHARQVPLNTMTWPWGARHWAEGWFLCDSDQLAAITAAGGLTGGELKFDDGVNTVTAQVRPLTPRPLSGDPSLDRLWLLILVDARYWWWDLTAGQIDVPESQSWESFVSEVASSLGTAVSFSGAAAAYGTVPRGFPAYDERLPDLLDRIGSAIQCRLVCGLDGGVSLLSSAEVRAGVAANFAGRADVSAGGAHPTLILPPSVRLTFPTTQDGEPRRARYTVSSSDGFPTGAVAGPLEKAFNTSAVAAYVSGALTNSAELAALGGRWSIDWYGLNGLSHDVRYVGVYAWSPDGATDLELADSHTRASSRHDDSDEIRLDAGAGTSKGDEYNYYFTDLVFEQTNWYWAGNNYWFINQGDFIQINGPGYVIINAPFKLYDGWWLHYRTLTPDDPQQDDWDISGLAGDDRVVVRVELDDDCDITGIVPTPDGGSGQTIVLLNTSEDFTFRLLHEDTDSVAENRLIVPGLIVLDVGPGSGVILWYDPDIDTERWRVVGFCCGSGTTPPTFSGALIYRDSDQSITDATYTKIDYDHSLYDTDSYADLVTPFPTRLTIPTDGYYHFGCHTTFQNGAVPAGDLKLRITATFLSGGGTSTMVEDSRKQVEDGSPSMSAPTQMSVSKSYYFHAGDYIESWVYQNCGAILDIESSAQPGSETEFWIFRVGA